MTDIRAFITKFDSSDVPRLAFAWNGKHATDFEDVNLDFRRAVVKEVLANPEAASIEKGRIFAGYVVEFAISDDYVSRFTPHTVGSSLHRELWIPSEELTEFNAQITNPLLVRRAFLVRVTEVCLTG